MWPSPRSSGCLASSTATASRNGPRSTRASGQLKRWSVSSWASVRRNGTIGAVSSEREGEAMSVVLESVGGGVFHDSRAEEKGGEAAVVPLRFVEKFSVQKFLRACIISSA